MFRSALAKHVLPFCVVDPPFVLLPVIKEGGEYRLKTAAELRELGYRRAADWFQRAEAEWNRCRGAKAEKQDLYGWLNYQGKLMKQDPEAEFVVLYNKSGTNVSAAALNRRHAAWPFFADYTTFWSPTQTRSESEFITAVLNAGYVNHAVKPFQSMGLLGERDICKKVLELPIPTFDKANAAHVRLAELGAVAARIVEKGVSEGSIAGSLAVQRRLARQAAAKELKEIDALVKKLLIPRKAK